ncbi:hypothetical protein ACWGTI_22475 [Mesorhizobium sp. ArgA1]
MFFLKPTHKAPVLRRLQRQERATIFHLGTPKTGTTYIQSLSRINQTKLMAAGIVYPDVRVEIGNYAHHSLAGDLEAPSPGAAAADYAALKNHAENIVISSEGFSELSPRGMKALADLHPHRRAFAVVYFREMSGFLRSFTQELVKHGWTESFATETYINRLRAFVEDPAKHNLGHYRQIAQRCAMAFGEPYTVFVAYNNVIDQGTDLFTHFWKSVVGISTFGMDISTPFPNRHVGFEALETNRLLNVALVKLGEEPGPWVHRWLLENLSEIKAEVAELVDLVSYRSSIKIHSEIEQFLTIERDLANHHSGQFLNASGRGRIFSQAHESELEWADIERFSADHPAAIKKLNALAWKCAKEALRD